MNDPKPNDGGPVHPVDPAYFHYAPAWPNQIQRDERAALLHGITLRDHFAGVALSGFCAHLGRTSPDYDNYASEAYKAADAMLAARTKEGP